MKIVINNNGERIPATLEVVDGVMIVSPKEEKVDITQFKKGDIVAILNDSYNKWMIAILDCLICEFADVYCMINAENKFVENIAGVAICNGIRYATEEEKQKLFDALAQEGKVWDSEKKAVVELKWKPKIGDKYNHPMCSITDDGMRYGSATATHTDSLFDKRLIKQNLAFKTKEECEAFCKRLNEAIEGVKP